MKPGSEEYINELKRQFYKKYTYQLEEAAGEEVDGKYVVWFYHTIMETNVGVYLDENDQLQEYDRR